MSDFKLVSIVGNPFVTAAINPTGAYDNTRLYKQLDSVSYGSASYIALIPTVGNLPTDANFWQQLSDTGPIGKSFLQGLGVPSSGLGLDDDTYLDLLTGDIYFKSSGSWTLTANIIGPQGIVGPQGSASYIYNALNVRFPFASPAPVTIMAAGELSNTNNTKYVLSFDDTTSEGILIDQYIPVCTNISFTILSNAKSAPAGAVKASVGLYFQEINDNLADSSWSSLQKLGDIDLPSGNVFTQEDTFTTSLASLGLTQNKFYRMELVRDPTDVNDDLVGDLSIEIIKVDFT